MCSAVSCGTQAQARNVGIWMVVAKMSAQNLRGVADGPRTPYSARRRQPGKGQRCTAQRHKLVDKYGGCVGVQEPHHY